MDEHADPAYKAEYEKASKELDEQEQRARDSSGRFVKTEEVKTEPVTLPKAEPEKPKEELETKPAEPAKEEEKPDPMAELRAEIARLDKVAKDNQAWGTRNAQELAALKRERDEAARIAARPKILDANPELEAAVRYVHSAPQQDDEKTQRYQAWRAAVESVHPGILGADVDPDLLKPLEARMQALGEEWGNPLIAIREITAEKLAHQQRQSERRIAAEVAKLTQKSAMSVPGSGGTSVTGGNTDADAVARIRNMSDAEFEKERRRTLGY